MSTRLDALKVIFQEPPPKSIPSPNIKQIKSKLRSVKETVRRAASKE